MKNFCDLKTTVFILSLTIAFWSCGESSAHKAQAAPKDTIQLLPPPGHLDSAEFKKYHNLVSDFIDRNLSERYFNGGILVAKNGVIVYERYSGFSNLRTKDSMTAETPLQVASTGKTLTAAAILKLVQEGKMNLDDLVTRFIPNFPYTDVTVKMLLNHRSGLPNYLYYMEEKGWDRNLLATNEDVLKTLAEWKPNKAYTAGKRYNYCNTNYVVLASVIERVSGIPYPQYMKDNFFTPLQMHNTFVKTIADTAVVYSYQPNGAFWTLDFSDGPYGDKNIYSTPRDLLKWDQALYHGKIISPALLDSAFKPYSHEKPGTKNYGLGWHLLMLPNDKKVIYHNGRWHGFNSAFARLTDEKITIIMACNKYNSGVYQVAKKMYNLFGPYDGRDIEQEEDGG